MGMRGLRGMRVTPEPKSEETYKNIVVYSIWPRIKRGNTLFNAISTPFTFYPKNPLTTYDNRRSGAALAGERRRVEFTGEFWFPFAC